MNGLSGWIKVYRKFSEWEWHDDPKMVTVWVHLLILANYEDKQWHDVTIERGQINIGLDSFSKTVGITVRELRTCLDRLCHLDMIMKKSTNKNTIITICNYDKYQSPEEVERQTNDKQTTNKRQTNDKQKEKEKKISPTPPIKENKKSEQEIKKERNISSSSEEAPKKKYSDVEKKLHGELKTIFCEEWTKTHGDEFYWSAAAMTSTIKIANQIKFYMPTEQKNDSEQLKLNFRIFVQKILTSSDNWLRANATPQIIASKFNEIYTSLKNGNASINTNRPDNRPSMVERTLSKYAAMYGSGQQDGGIGSQC